MAPTESREQEATHLLEEGRMVLPGVQALFGFQLIAVFTEPFQESSDAFRATHLGATGVTALSILFLMAPAAFHRRAHPHTITQAFLRFGTVVLQIGMFFLAVSMSLEFYLISLKTIARPGLAAALSIALFVLFAAGWYAIPTWFRNKN